MNKIFKIFGILVLVAMPAFADDDVAFDDSRMLAERTDCAAVASEIATINSTEDPDEDMLARLAELQTIQRRDCSKTTGRRRAMGRGGKMAAVVAAAQAAEYVDDTEYVEYEIDEEMSTDDAVADVDISEIPCDELDEKIAGLDSDTDADTLEIYTAEFDARCIPVEVSKTPEEIAELIASGLCADGSKPNKFGCCGDEKFKDLGDGVFGCCPPDENADCFPPITK